jgi:1-acyl-sn-glycerol-3-phosphate acyltransferase
LLFRGPFGRSLRSVQHRILDAFLRLLFVYDCQGQHHVPPTGGAVIASNHPSYLDSILLSVRLRRPIRFMAWEKLFKVPVLGWIIRSFGAFPVNPAPGKGREAYERAKALVQAGKVVGMFPEAHRSRTSQMEPTVREGAARLAWETGAPLVPAAITGAYRAWPYFRPLPRPAHIRVRFHEPIDPKQYAGLSENEAIGAILVEWRRRVDRSLKPGAKADEKISRIYVTPAPPPRLHEVGLAVLASALLALQRAPLWYHAAPLAYLLYLAADARLIPQMRKFKWVRNTSPLVFILLFGPTLLGVLEAPSVPANAALAAVLVGSLLPYFYGRSKIAVGFIRGLVIAAGLELGAQWLVPSGLGPHVALPVYAGGYAVLQRTVFWKYAAPFLGLYALAATWYMGGRSELAVHLAAGALACGFSQLWPYHVPRRPADQPPADGGPTSDPAAIDNPDTPIQQAR